MRPAIVLLLACAVRASSADIALVYPDKPTGQLRIPAFPGPEIDWKAAVIQKLGSGIEKPTAKHVAELWDKFDMGECGCSEESVFLPLPATLKDRFYYRFSSAGVELVKPRRLVGLVSYFWADQNVIDKIEYYGYLELEGNVVKTAAAFVLVSDHPLKFKVTPVDKSSASMETAIDQQPKLSWSAGGAVRTTLLDWLLGGGKAFHTSRILVKSDKTEYLFVQWTYPEDSCQFGFSLIKLSDEAIEEAAASSYRCDNL